MEYQQDRLIRRYKRGMGGKRAKTATVWKEKGNTNSV